MQRSHYVLLGIVLTVAGLLAFSAVRSSQFERKARDAERFLMRVQQENAVLAKRVAKRDTVIVRARAIYKEIDKVNPVPDTCRPNIEARDRVIEAQADQILDLGTALARATQATDTLAAALRARPKPLLNLGFIEIGLPKLGVFAGACSDGLCVGAGIVVPLKIGG